MERFALEATGVSKRFGDHVALDAVDLAVERGVIHGLLGPNGAGKTTLMRVLLGLVRPDAGAVRLLDSDLASCRGSVPARVAGAIDSPAFYPYLSGRENLRLLALLDDERESTDTRLAEALLEVGLESSADRLVRGYSAGMRQRLGLAAARLRRPDLLFLDEPTSSLDPTSARQVRTLVRQMASEGTAIVFSSHDMAEVEELCATLTVIDRGRVVFSGAVADLRARTPGDVCVLHTSDDAAARSIASGDRRLRLARTDDDGLELSGPLEALDGLVIALGCTGIAIRSMERRQRSLESLFVALTAASGAVPAAESTVTEDLQRSEVLAS